MATLLENGVRRTALIDPAAPQASGSFNAPNERFMGTAQQVPRPALPNAAAPAAPATPTVGAANLNGSGSAPIGNGGLNAARTAATDSGAAARALGGVRGAINGGLGRVAIGAAGLQAVGDSLAEDSTDRYAKRFGVDAPTGDGSFGDIAKFAALRAGGFASDLGNRITGGLAQKYLYRDGDTPPVAAAAPVNASATLQGAAPAVAAPAAPEALAGTPLFGAEGVRRVPNGGPGGSTLYTNATSNAADDAFRASRGTVSTVGGGPEVTASLRRAGDLQAEISAMRAGLADRGDTSAYLRGAAQTASLAPGGISAETKAQIDRITGGGRKNLTAAGVQAVNNLIATEQANQRGYAEIGERARATDINAGLTQRGQDITDLGQQRTQQTAIIAAQRAQRNADRDYGLRAAEFGQRQAEFGTKQENEAFDQRQKATSGLADRYGKQFTTVDKDGKSVTDTARVAKFTQGVQQFLGNRQAELAAKIQDGSATPAEVKAHNDIARKGVAALDESDLSHIESLIKLGERSEQTANFVTGGRHVQSNNPADYEVVGRKQNLLGSDTLSLRGGGTIREADTKYTEGGNVLLPNWLKQRTTDFDQAKGLRK